jgi:3-phosphoshikimate 1-carboxyvinyltransferase
MTDVFVAPAESIQGELRLPGDKSISHRAVMLALLTDGAVDLYNVAPSEDVASTVDAIQALGATVDVDPDDPTHLNIFGVGMRGLTMDDVTVDAGNAGTLVRLIAGVLAGQHGGAARLVGDASLSARPMRRITDPLTLMGADIQPTEDGTLPMTVRGNGPLTGIEYELPVASAQVQSALLLAGLYADGPTTVTEPAAFRDHTERMLARCGVQISRTGSSVTVEPADSLTLPTTTIPADPSSAAPFLLAATLLHGSFLRVPDLCANPGRLGFVDLLDRMGARVAIVERRTIDGEPVANVEATYAALQRVDIREADIPLAIDELPIFALACQFCKGTTTVHGAQELRVKESDRITTLVTALRRIGVNAEELADGFVVNGSGARPDGGSIHAEGDHRIAMLGAVAGLVSRQGVTIHDAECVDVSFPGFFDALGAVAMR